MSFTDNRPNSRIIHDFQIQRICILIQCRNIFSNIYYYIRTRHYYDIRFKERILYILYVVSCNSFCRVWRKCLSTKPVWCVFKHLRSDLTCVKAMIKTLMSRDMRCPTMWFVRPAKAQTSLRIRAV